MAIDPKKPRKPEFDLVEDDEKPWQSRPAPQKQPPAKPGQPAPAARKSVPPTPAKPAPKPQRDFDLIDDEPPKPAARKSVPPGPAARKSVPPTAAARTRPAPADDDVVDCDVVDCDVVDAAPARPPRPTRPKVRVVRLGDPDDDGRSNGRSNGRRKRSFTDEINEQNEERERKKRRMTYGDQWILPTIALAVGVFGSSLAAANMEGTAGAVSAVVTMLVILAVATPIFIGVLMVVGSVMAIEYGELHWAILKLSAVVAVTNAIFFICVSWIGLPFFLVYPVSGIIGFAMFMSFFELDVQETVITLGALNLVQTALFWIVMGMAVLAVRHEIKKGGGFDDDFDDPDPPPADVRPGDGMDPDDDRDDGDIDE
jgi:hypothetical protein